jgi:hypothetical protein
MWWEIKPASEVRRYEHKNVDFEVTDGGVTVEALPADAMVSQTMREGMTVGMKR